MIRVIVVTYNSAGWIRRCLASVSDTQAIVVDNASSDETVPIVTREFPTVLLVERHRNGGFTVAVNQGAALAPEDDILLLNPDAVARNGSLAALAAYLQTHPRVGIVAPRLLNPDGSRQDNIRTFPTPLTMLARRSPVGWTPLGKRILRDHFLHESGSDFARPIPATIGAAMLVRREALDEIGPMDERIFLYGEDWDWCYRMWAAGWEVHIEPQAVMEHEYERKSRRTFDLRSAAVRHHWASALKLLLIHPGLLVGRTPDGARRAAAWRP